MGICWDAFARSGELVPNQWKNTSPATSSREGDLSVCIGWGEPNESLTGAGTTHCWNQSLTYGGDSFKPKFIKTPLKSLAHSKIQ